MASLRALAEVVREVAYGCRASTHEAPLQIRTIEQLILAPANAMMAEEVMAGMRQRVPSSFMQWIQASPEWDTRLQCLVVRLPEQPSNLDWGMGVDPRLATAMSGTVDLVWAPDGWCRSGTATGRSWAEGNIVWEVRGKTLVLPQASRNLWEGVAMDIGILCSKRLDGTDPEIPDSYADQAMRSALQVIDPGRFPKDMAQNASPDRR